MEYLIGSLLTIFTMVILSRKLSATQKENIPVVLKNSQAHTYSLLEPILPYIITNLKKRKKTQSSEHHKKSQVRIIFTSTEAYWIAANNLYVAQLINGAVDEDSVKIVDTMAMDKVQLDKMVFIVDQLTEGLANDNSGSGD